MILSILDEFNIIFKYYCINFQNMVQIFFLKKMNFCFPGAKPLASQGLNLSDRSHDVTFVADLPVCLTGVCPSQIS
jgi:hypothetical protein